MRHKSFHLEIVWKLFDPQKSILPSNLKWIERLQKHIEWTDSNRMKAMNKEIDSLKTQSFL